MPRSRSRSLSPSRRRRSKSRDRDRDRDRDRNRDRDRRRRRSRERRRSVERSRHRSRSRSRSRERQQREKETKKPGARFRDRPAIPEVELQGKTEEEKEMMRVMGFSNFDTTKGKKVENNEEGQVHVILKRKYRQYMNRKGGFNRPLDFVA